MESCFSTTVRAHVIDIMRPLRPLLLISSVVILQATVFSSTAMAQAVLVPGVFSTGVDNNGNVLPTNTSDPHYVMSGGGSVALDANLNWIPPMSGSKWIGQMNGNVNAPVGTVVYTMTFDMTGYQPMTAVLNGMLASDNNVTLTFNGNVISNNCCFYWLFTQKVIQTGFLPGINTLEFAVENTFAGGQNASGLLFSDVTVMAQPDVTPVLAVNNLVAGSQADLDVAHATPGGPVVYAYSLTGTGPTPLGYTFCNGAVVLSLLPPLELIGVATANSIGNATFTQTVPNAQFLQVNIQALDYTTCIPTNVVTDTIQ